MSHECTRDQYLLNDSADVTFRRRWCPRMTTCAIVSPPSLLQRVNAHGHGFCQRANAHGHGFCPIKHNWWIMIVQNVCFVYIAHLGVTPLKYEINSRYYYCIPTNTTGCHPLPFSVFLRPNISPWLYRPPSVLSSHSTYTPDTNVLGDMLLIPM